MDKRVVSPSEYYCKITRSKNEFPFDFTSYLPRKHQAVNTNWSLLLVWNRLLNQLHEQCVFISFVPNNLECWFDLSEEPRTYEFSGPRTIRVVASLTDQAVDELQRIIMADDAIAYLEFVVYGYFPVPNRNMYIQEFVADYYPIMKNYKHFQSILDRDYIVQLRREFESRTSALVK